MERCSRKWASRIAERDEIPPFAPPLGAPQRFSHTVFSFAPNKRPENIPHPEEVISGQQRLHAYRGRFQVCKDSYLQKNPHDADGPFGYWMIPNVVSRLMVHPLSLSEDSEDHFRYMGADADRWPL